MRNSREELARCVEGMTGQHVIQILDEFGDPLNLDGRSVIAKARKAEGVQAVLKGETPGASTAYVPTVTKRSQVDRNVGVIEVDHTAGNLDQPSRSYGGQPYWLDVFVGASGSEKPVDREYAFWVRAKETFA